MYPVHHLLNRTTARGLDFLALFFSPTLAFKVEDETSKKEQLFKI